MCDPYEKPYIYMEAAPACSVFGSEVPISPDHLDTLVLYRWCPGRLKEMDYVLTNASPPPGYTAQPLLYVLNPEPEYDPADGAIYMEIPESGGQCVFLNFDMSGLVSYRTRYCTGATPDGVPPFVPGTYDGRVELMSTILDVIMGLPPTHPGAKNGGGGGGTSDVKPAEATYRWVLAQNKPNPAMGRTEIRFEVAHPSRVSIRVYNAMGQLVRTLVNERREPGRYTVHWNGLNDSGRKVSTGVYFYRMQARNFAATKKMLLLD
jgi:hypothetical protein